MRQELHIPCHKMLSALTTQITAIYRARFKWIETKTMKRILINATQPEELRVAMVDGQKLYDLDIENNLSPQRKANVYKGKITRIEPSLEAAFVEYGADRHGFLPLKEVARSYFKKDPGNGKINIKDVLDQGQELIVQVEKEERGNKGAALTTFISLAGRFLVLMPNNPRAGGVSRRVESDDRGELRDALSELEIPQGMGVIARTAAVERDVEELQWDLDYLTQVWSAVEAAAEGRSAPFLIFAEGNVIVRTLRDYLRPEIGEVVIDDKAVYEQAQAFMQKFMPRSTSRVKFYDEEVPLFSRFQIESQIETAFCREVTLPSGGAIVIDRTEALTSVDVNSARSTGGGGIEETALNTNLEAAEEVGRQLRLRDLGGLLVIDFIDMSASKNQKQVEQRLRDAVQIDRARVQIGRISRFGLLEMSRQRLRPSLGESAHGVCPRCSGQGTVRGVESLALSVLRLIEEEALKDKTGRVVARLPVAVATFLLNEKRDILTEVETRCKIRVTILPVAEMETPHYDIRRIRDDQLKQDGNNEVSYEYKDVDEEEEIERTTPQNRIKAPEQPAVQLVNPTEPAPAPKPKDVVQVGIFVKLWRFFFGGMGEGTGKPKKSKKTTARQDNRRNTKGGNRKSTQQNRNSRNQQSKSGRGQQQNKNTRSNNKQNENRKDKQQKGARNNTRKSAADSKNRDNTRDQKTETTQGKAADSSPKDNQNGNQDGGNRSGNRRRGRRGGRRNRRPDNNNAEQKNVTAQNEPDNNRPDNNQNSRSQAPQQPPKSEDKPSDTGQKASPSNKAAGADQATTASSSTRGKNTEQPAASNSSKVDERSAAQNNNESAKKVDKPQTTASPAIQQVGAGSDKPLPPLGDKKPSDKNETSAA